jgi:hypothetical protein
MTMRSMPLAVRYAIVIAAFSLGVAFSCGAQVAPSPATSDAVATNDVKTAAEPLSAIVDPLATSDAEVAVAAPSAAALPALPAFTASPVAPPSAASESDWHFAVSPYLWVPWVYGSVGANGQNFHYYATPDELFSHFRFGLLGLVDTRYKRVVMPLDILWMRLGDDKALPLSPTGTVANIKLDMFILTPKIGYRVVDTKMIKIDALAGFRYWHIGTNFQFTTNTLNFSRSINFVDPLVGGRITGNLSDKVSVVVAGDVGGWGTGSQLDYQVGAFLGYRIKPALALQAGYRYLSLDYTNGDRLLNLNISGPLFGVTINLK